MRLTKDMAVSTLRKVTPVVNYRPSVMVGLKGSLGADRGFRPSELLIIGYDDANLWHREKRRLRR